MKLFAKKDPVQAELEKLMEQEGKFLAKNRGRKEFPLNRFLQDKIPDKLRGTLEAAFAKAFSLIFEKGTGIIEKTYPKEELEKRSSIRQYAADVRGDRKSLKSFARQAAGIGAGNTLASAAAGVGMGLLGIGIPDIPLLTGMMLRSIYETALHYGFSYNDDEEKRFILLLIQGAMTHGERLEQVNEELNFFMEHGSFPQEEKMEELIRNTAGILSDELLYMKFLQGIPIAGVIGGAEDAVYMSRINEYARLKYHRRFCLGRQNGMRSNEKKDIETGERMNHAKEPE